MEDDYYDILGVSPGASCEQIRRAYQRHVVVQHRRGIWRFQGKAERAQLALAVLTDPVERERYDRLRELQVRKRSGDHYDKLERELAIRQDYGVRLEREVRSRGAAAVEEHAAELAALEQEFDARAERAQLAQRRAQMLRLALQLGFVLALVAGAVCFWPGR